MQGMNTLLFGQTEAYVPLPIQTRGDSRLLGVERAEKRHWLVMPGSDGLDLDGEVSVVDLARGLRRALDQRSLKQLLGRIDTPHLVTEAIG